MDDQVFTPDDGENKAFESFIESTKDDALRGWSEERYIAHIKELQQHIQNLYDNEG